MRTIGVVGRGDIFCALLARGYEQLVVDHKQACAVRTKNEGEICATALAYLGRGEWMANPSKHGIRDQKASGSAKNTH